MRSDGVRQAGILLMALGEDAAAAVLQHLPAREVQQLSASMTDLSQVTRDQVNEVLEDFRLETEQYSALHLDSAGYLRTVLTKALGNDRAADMLDNIIKPDESTTGLQRLNQLEPTEIVELIRDEHPQIIATLLVHMDRNKASAVLTGLLSGEGVKRSRLGGVRAAAEIVNQMSSTNEESVIKHVREHDEALAQRMIEEMFLFENLLGLEDRAIQLLLKEVDSESLIIALKGAPQELRDKFLKNMSQRAAEMLREDLEARGPVRVSQVETEQKSILMVARRLADAGEIVISVAADDSYV
jgi:flagellar motor switch protein FliG